MGTARFALTTDQPESLESAAEKCVRWLDRRLETAGRGDLLTELPVEPSGTFWLGRLAPEEAVIEMALGDRGERLDPCAIGMTVRPEGDGPWELRARISVRVWLKGEDRVWRKSAPANQVLEFIHPVGKSQGVYGGPEISGALKKVAGIDRFSAELRVDLEDYPPAGLTLTIMLVNTSAKDDDLAKDGNLYECALEVEGIRTVPFTLAALPDSFRYDRRVPAYGLNCGVVATERGLSTSDTIVVETKRPGYLSGNVLENDLSFGTLAQDPVPSLRRLLEAAQAWGDSNWGDAALANLGERDLWTSAMSAQAQQGKLEFSEELDRMSQGLDSLENDPDLLLAFKLMNEAIEHSSRGKYSTWRPFQLGFLLANVESLVSPEAASKVVDIVWFATGGGKTETYLGLLVMAALFDRMKGKSHGISAWSRFPLRMLSLQQTQRFADALAGAELSRRKAELGGVPFGVGFLVGQAGTPNRIPLDPKESWQPDPDDDQMPGRFKVLLYCPFCFSEDIEMRFDRRSWRLLHCCQNKRCPWKDEGLPFHIVDEEIFRVLPTVVVGTLDKAASLGLQAAMRGLVGSPLGACSMAGHGFTYAQRNSRPNGCLVPGCRGTAKPLPMKPELFAPQFRLQDELHLLRDSLGAVDAHYEALADHLQVRLGGVRPKILASSATLAGFHKQVDVLYRRRARVFPVQGPTADASFWTHQTSSLARHFVAIAPRGVTLEFVTDRLLTELQKGIRELLDNPEETCKEIGVDPIFAEALVSLYGVNVAYGNSLRDLDAVSRSLESQQVQVDPLNFESLTGRTPFEDVRSVLRRLDTPEPNFAERLHVITASSMMSHGVDIDRLNVMVMLGIPLATAEFIQTSARVGRAMPGLVVVLHKIARERDASVFRFFPQFIKHGDRFVEPVPITRRSRRVLKRTISGVQLARVHHIHEPLSGGSLTTVGRLRQYFRDSETTFDMELLELIALFELEKVFDQLLINDLRDWLTHFFRNLEDPGGTFTKPADLCPTGPPMISLRDVEEQAIVRESLR